jgi:hypothetical protein
VKFLHDFERKAWRTTIIFLLPFQRDIELILAMGKAYSLPSCPDQLAVRFWIPDPVTFYVLSYSE